VKPRFTKRVLAIFLAVAATLLLVTPAHADAITGSATTAAPLVAGELNAAEILVTFTNPTALTDEGAILEVSFTGAENVNITCQTVPVTVNATFQDPSRITCTELPNGIRVNFQPFQGDVIPAGSLWTVTVAAKTLRVDTSSANNNLEISLQTFKQGTQLVDQGIIFVPVENAPVPPSPPVPSEPTLAHTGFSAALPLGTSGLLLAAGLTAVMLRRRYAR